MLLLYKTILNIFILKSNTFIRPKHTFVRVTHTLVKLSLRKSDKHTFSLSHFLEEIQCDLADFTKTAEENDGYRYAFCAIDVFSRCAWAIPIKTKQPADIINAFNEVIKVIGKLERLWSDSEGSLQSTEFVNILNNNEIKHKISLSPAPYVERFVGTMKMMIH